MKLLRLFLPLLLCTAISLRAQEQRPQFVLLLDVSGSMERDGGIQYQRYSGGEIKRISSSILDSVRAANVDGDWYVDTFSSSHEPFGETGPLRGNGAVLSSLPQTARGLETELDFAIRKALDKHHNAFIFLVTDNQNDFSGNHSDHAFYDILAMGEPRIHAVFFVPLADTRRANDALVMYALAVDNAPVDRLHQIADRFAATGGTEAVQFKPLYSAQSGIASLSFQPKVYEVEDGDLITPDEEGDDAVIQLDEGAPLTGELDFFIHSNLRTWKIVGAELQKVATTAEVPPQFANSAAHDLKLSLRGNRTLTVDPGKNSINVYRLPLSALADDGLQLDRASLFDRSLPDIPVNFQFTVTATLSPNPQDSSLQPVFPENIQARIRAVRNLPEILNEMTFQPDQNGASAQTRTIPFHKEVLLRVKPNGFKNAVAMGIIVLPILLLLGGLALVYFFFLNKKRLVITEVGVPGQRTISFSKASPQRELRAAKARLGSIRWLGGNTFRILPLNTHSSSQTKISGLPERVSFSRKSAPETIVLDFTAPGKRGT